MKQLNYKKEEVHVGVDTKMNNKDSSQKPNGIPTMAAKGEKSDRCRLYDVLRPFIAYMSVFGIYFIRPPSAGNKGYISNPLRIYSAIILSITWANFLRFFTVYDYSHIAFSADLCFSLTMHFWFLLCAINSAIMYRACSRQDLLWGFFQQWYQDLKDQPYEFEYGCEIRAMSWVVGLLTAVIVIFSFTYFAVFLFTTSYMDKFLAPLKGLSDDLMTGVKAAVLILYMYLTTAWMLPVSFVFQICVALYVQFKTFQKQFARNIAEDGTFQGDFEQFRKRHQRICRLVERVDDTFSPLHGSGTALNLALSMVLLYVIIWYEPIRGDRALLGMVSFWLAYSLLTIVFICSSGGIVNHMAHAPLSDVYNIDLKRNRDITPEVPVFLSRLTGTSIGLTAFGMFVIDKPAILTLFGVFVTYFLVLVQFQPAHSTPSDTCNCTELLLNYTLFRAAS